MLRRVMLALLAVVSLLTLACTSQSVLKDKELRVYAPVEPRLAEAVQQAFREAHPEVKLQLLYQQEGDPADMVLAGEELLRAYKQEGRLQPLDHGWQDQLWGDGEGYWQNFFYDPAVLLVNQHFARQVGQRHLRGWSDLERLEQGRLVLEGLTNSVSTRGFLGSYASYLGEEEAMASLRRLEAHVQQYVKLPFTPVRMVAVGDADLAITRQSYVAKYLESSFPAYVVLPMEGTPVNLYGLALLEEGRNREAANILLGWLRREAGTSMAAQEQEMGFSFLYNLDTDAATPQQLWINSNYLTSEKEKDLTNKWLHSVRFSARS